jgi:hypothetical protein
VDLEHRLCDPAGQRVRICIKVTAVVPNFSLAASEQDILRWEPSIELPNSCKQTYEDWQRRAIAHEQEHVRRSEEIVRNRNAGWNSYGFTPTVCATGSDRTAALNNAREVARQRVDSRVRRSAQEIAAALDRDEAKMHQTNQLDFMNCSSCP